MTISRSSSLGYVVSDLHIFGCASRYQRPLKTLPEIFAHYSVVVLNGDTFDFKRSVFKSSRETTQHAIDWMKEICRSCPDTRFEYLLGNHDCHKIFTAELAKLSSELPNLRVSEEILRIGSSLFLHGDVVDLKTGAVDLATVRKRYADIEPQLSSMIFATLVSHFRLNAIEYLRHSKAALAKKILGYLRIQHPSDLEGTNAIYFGHTHVPFANFLYEGIRFYNSGSLIRGLRWNPVEFEL